MGSAWLMRGILVRGGRQSNRPRKRPGYVRSASRDDGQQESRVEATARVDRVRPPVDAVPRIRMLEGDPLIVPRPDLEHQPMPGGQNDAGRPDLDLDTHRLAGLELLDLVVGV